MGDLDDLYQEVILDHNRKPRNFRELPEATAEATGHNRLCGDKLHLQVRLQDGRLVDIAFQGSGCAIFKASASMMTEALKGHTREEAESLYHTFHDMVTEGVDPDESLGKLAAFSGISEFPARVKCASLAWHTLKAALEGQEKEPVSTE
jgi:nitrogen fixation NifU-like protein